MRIIDADELLDIAGQQGHVTVDDIINAETIEAEPRMIDLQDDDFGAVLNCAVRYAIGRSTYMPSIVIGFIAPLIPHLNDKTLWCFDQDITEARWNGGYGDPEIDEPVWMKFHEAVREELIKRGLEPYKSWRENTCERKVEE